MRCFVMFVTAVCILFLSKCKLKIKKFSAAILEKGLLQCSLQNGWKSNLTTRLVIALAHCSANAEAMAWNPVEALSVFFFFRLKFAIA